jgi:ubiquinol-cytochrome c reductase cytochrome c subunit
MRSRRRSPLLVAALVAGLALAPAAASESAPSGEQLYGRYCTSCHGALGEGVSAGRAARGNPGSTGSSRHVAGPSLRGVGARAADFYLSTGYMPLLEVGQQPKPRSLGERLLSTREIDALIRYVASFGNGPPVPSPQPQRGNVAEGMRLFTQHCAGCHQIAAEGGYVTGALAPPLSQTTAVRVAEAVRIGPWVMPRFSERVISDDQLNSIVAYVLTSQEPNDAGGWSLGHIGPVPAGMVTWLLAAVVLVAVCMVIGRRGTRE